MIEIGPRLELILAVGLVVLLIERWWHYASGGRR